jgi:hypothetical protein
MSDFVACLVNQKNGDGVPTKFKAGLKGLIFPRKSGVQVCFPYCSAKAGKVLIG